ncbi:hypothetical protein HN587_04455 [Candidatus Woesearchaeota archaeon]|jgi:phosphate uptake regulator|nr:hypothetical protein [Candidatus Woesearchaeota archaeon]
MKRKVVKQGAATLMVSLPSKWAKENKIKKGSEINIDITKNNLLQISSDEIEVEYNETTIELTKQIETSIRTLIVNTYRSGYDKILVKFETEKQFHKLNEIIKTHLIGFDISHKAKNSCLIENITEPAPDQFEKILRKVFFNISELIEVTRSRINGEETDYYIEIQQRIQKYDNFCRRMISKKGLEFEEANLFWAFLNTIIHGQRELYHLNKYLDKNKTNFKDFKFVNRLKNLFNLLKEAYLYKDISKAELVHEKEKIIIYKDFYSEIKKKNAENIVYFHLASSAKHFYLSTSPLIGMLLSPNNSV